MATPNITGRNIGRPWNSDFTEIMETFEDARDVDELVADMEQEERIVCMVNNASGMEPMLKCGVEDAGREGIRSERGQIQVPAAVEGGGLRLAGRGTFESPDLISLIQWVPIDIKKSKWDGEPWIFLPGSRFSSGKVRCNKVIEQIKSWIKPTPTPTAVIKCEISTI